MPALDKSALPTDRAVARAGFTSYSAVMEKARGRVDPNFGVKLRAGKLPSNHPFIPVYAQALKMSRPTFVRIFARAAPLPEGRASALASHRRRLHIPESPTQAERRPPMTRHATRDGSRTTLDPTRADHALMLAANIPSLSALASTALGTKPTGSGSFVNKLRAHAVPPNHPYIPRLASTLNTSVDKVVEVFSGDTPPMSETIVKRLASAGPGPRKRRALAKTNGHGPVKVVKGKYNKFKKGAPLDLRQATRSIMSTLNVATMAGETSITLPIDALYPLLADYVERCHIKGAVLISPDFAEQFG